MDRDSDHMMALTYYELATADPSALGDDAYGNIVRGAVAAGRKRIARLSSDSMGWRFESFADE